MSVNWVMRSGESVKHKPHAVGDRVPWQFDYQLVY